MTEQSVPAWLAWARELQAISQIGLTYSDNEFDTQRYGQVAELASQIVAAYTTLSPASILENFAVQPGYATPKVDVRGAVVREGKVLLVQDWSDGRWCMPGGWADVGDAPSATVVREVWEESGFEVVTGALIGVYDANRSGVPLSFYHAYKLVFLCEITGGTAHTSHETLAVDFFPFDELPPLSLARTDERHLADVLAHVRDPGRPARFD